MHVLDDALLREARETIGQRSLEELVELDRSWKVLSLRVPTHREHRFRRIVNAHSDRS
jgi:hypothetical protein